MQVAWRCLGLGEGGEMAAPTTTHLPEQWAIWPAPCTRKRTTQGWGAAGKGLQCPGEVGAAQSQTWLVLTQSCRHQLAKAPRNCSNLSGGFSHEKIFISICPLEKFLGSILLHLAVSGISGAGGAGGLPPRHCPSRSRWPGQGSHWCL